jgi:DNA-binding IclR family transcriptional regulator
MQGRTIVSARKRRGTAAIGTSDRPAKPGGGVERIRLLLDLLAMKAPVSVSDAAAQTRLPLSTSHKVLQELVASGLAVFDDRRRLYSPGSELYRLAALLTQGGPMTMGVKQVLRDLASSAEETVCLNWLDGDRKTYTVMAIEEGPGPLQYVVEPGGKLPLYAGASGRAILAFMPEAERRRYLGRRRVGRLTAETIVDGGLLKSALEQTRKNGYAVSHGERLVGAIGIAAPIFDGQDHVVGSLQLTIPQHRFVRRRLRSLAKLVQQHATRLRGQFVGVR